MSKRKILTNEEFVKAFEKAFEGVDFAEQPAQQQACHSKTGESETQSNLTLTDEPQAHPAQQQEPYVHAISGRTADELWLETGRLRSELADLKTQQQEPVGRFTGSFRAGDGRMYFEVACHPDQPLPALMSEIYTSPQPAQPSKPWVGLTDAEFQWIYDNGRTPAGMIEMAEAKLREKNA